MGKKLTESRPKNAGGYSSKSYKKPDWMKKVRMFFLFLLSFFMLLAIFGLFKHLISHFK